MKLMYTIIIIAQHLWESGTYGKTNNYGSGLSRQGNFVLFLTKQGCLWLGMTGAWSFNTFKSGIIRQVVFERRGLKIQGPLYNFLFYQKKLRIGRKEKRNAVWSGIRSFVPWVVGGLPSEEDWTLCSVIFRKAS